MNQDEVRALKIQLADLASDGMLRRRREIRTSSGGWCEIRGRKLRNFASNDYLDLAHHPEVCKAASDAIAEYGFGSTASALICGRTPLHAQLEEALSQFEQTPSALLFPTGFAANLGTLTSLIQADDVVFCDRFNHASLVEGCRASRARLRIYRHSDLDSLEADLEKHSRFPQRWIVTDSVFSMDGDVAPLKQLCHLAGVYRARVIVDEAHATGVLGPNGRGVCEEQQVCDQVYARIGTLSKSLGSLGGFVAGPKELIDYLWNSATTQIYSTALPPACCAAALAALAILHQQPQRRARLHQLSQQFKQDLEQRGVSVSASALGPIFPVIIGDNDRTMAVAARLEEQGMLVGAIRPPTVSLGTARLRISLSSGHDEAALKALAQAIGDGIEAA